MRARTGLVLACLLVGCGGAAAEPPPAVPRAAKEPPLVAREPSRPRMNVEYVVIHTRWVEKNIAPPAADVSAWYETGEGRAALPPERHELFFKEKAAADKAKAQLENGVSYERVLESAINRVVDKDRPPPRDAAADAAFEQLVLGKTVVVKAGGGFLLLEKAKPADDAIERAYRKAKAPETTQKLADAIHERLETRSVEARAAIAQSVAEVLGDKAVADPNRPSPVVVDEDRLRIARVPPGAKKALEALLKEGRGGDRLPAPIASGSELVVARAIAPPGRAR